MNFTEFKKTINQVESCDELGEPYTFERFLTTLQNIVLNLDKIEKHVDEGADRIIDKLDK